HHLEGVHGLPFETELFIYASTGSVFPDGQRCPCRRRRVVGDTGNVETQTSAGVSSGVADLSAGLAARPHHDPLAVLDLLDADGGLPEVVLGRVEGEAAGERGRGPLLVQGVADRPVVERACGLHTLDED